MTDSREAQFLKLVKDFPTSPMGFFSLGRLYVSERRYPEAITTLERAVELDPNYAAALVSLGEAYASAGRSDDAKGTYQKAKEAALAQNHPGLAEEIDEKLQELD
jgi:tetratricopeptide (TPR) repeat protein